MTLKPGPENYVELTRRLEHIRGLCRAIDAIHAAADQQRQAVALMKREMAARRAASVVPRPRALDI